MKLTSYHVDFSEAVQQINPHDLPDPYPTIAEIVGIEKALALSQELGGTSVYFQSYENITRALRDATIRKDIQAGNSYKAIARKYGMSQSRVREIVKQKRSEG